MRNSRIAKNVQPGSGGSNTLPRSESSLLIRLRAMYGVWVDVKRWWRRDEGKRNDIYREKPREVVLLLLYLCWKRWVF